MECAARLGSWMNARSFFRGAIQYAKFSCVGILATASHVTIFMALTELCNAKPLVANVLAFCVAVLVSFFGHSHWTFGGGVKETALWSQRQRAAFARFITVPLLGLVLNSLSILLVVDVGGLSHRYAVLPMIFVVPPVIFLISKFWVFRPA